LLFVADVAHSYQRWQYRRPDVSRDDLRRNAGMTG
jgi:hypothetical protein